MKKVAPKSVSGRVVKTVTSRPASGSSSAESARGAMVKTTSAPVDLPIQLRCMVMTRSGHESSLSKSSSSRSA